MNQSALDGPWKFHVCETSQVILRLTDFTLGLHNAFPHSAGAELLSLSLKTARHISLVLFF